MSVVERRERRGRAWDTAAQGVSGASGRRWCCAGRRAARRASGVLMERVPRVLRVGEQGAGRKKRGGRRREKGKEKKKERRKEKEKMDEKKKGGGAGGIHGDGREHATASAGHDARGTRMTKK